MRSLDLTVYIMSFVDIGAKLRGLAVSSGLREAESKHAKGIDKE